MSGKPRLPFAKPRRKPKAKLKPLQRSGPIRSRGRSRFPARRDPAFLDWVRRQPCAVTGLVTGQWSAGRVARIEAAHLKTRGAGGLDLGNAIPLVWWLHREQHVTGWASFARRYLIKPAILAQELAERYRRECAARGTV